jgi:hypothetical protein
MLSILAMTATLLDLSIAPTAMNWPERSIATRRPRTCRRNGSSTASAKKPEAPHQLYEPLMVVRTNSHEIINNHNGFFKPEFVDFLVRYVTDIENKRFHQTSQRRSLSQRQSR